MSETTWLEVEALVTVAILLLLAIVYGFEERCFDRAEDIYLSLGIGMWTFEMAWSTFGAILFANMDCPSLLESVGIILLLVQCVLKMIFLRLACKVLVQE